MRHPTADVSSVVHGVISRSIVATRLRVATAQVITRLPITCAMCWDAQQSRDNYVVTRWRNAPTAKETTLLSAEDAQREPKPPGRHGRVG